MRIAIALCKNRIAPLLDVAKSYLLVDAASADSAGRLLAVEQSCLSETSCLLQGQGVDVLLCGAVSRAWLKCLSDGGVEVHAFLMGDVHEVLQSFLCNGPSGLARFAMPGCNLGGHAPRRRQCRRMFCDFDSPFKE